MSFHNWISGLLQSPPRTSRRRPSTSSHRLRKSSRSRLARARLAGENLEVRAVLATLLPGFVEATFASSLVGPTTLEFSPDGKLFVAEERGTLPVFSATGARLQNNFFRDTPIVVSTSGERGLLGVAFDPQYATNRYVYAYYTATTPTIHNRLSRFTANAAGDLALAGSETVLMELETVVSTNHNGGAIHFGPDGKLYLAVGDGTVGSNSQVLTNRQGKILRINSDGSIPTDNPFSTVATGANRSIWALGLRNPFTFAFQPGTGRMLINDVGQDTWEEINEGASGANYGWPTTEGPTTDSRFVSPFHAYDHAVGQAIVGAAFYNPETQHFPSQYTGDFFYADFVSSFIQSIDLTTRQVTTFATDAGNPVDLRVGDDGRLYYLSRDLGIVRRVSASTGQAPMISQHPLSLTVSEGDDATFSVTASGSAPLTYQWQRNGVNISGASSSSYTRQSVTAADSGASFRVIVTNSFGSVTSQAAELTVTTNQRPTATIVTPAAGTTFSAGTTVMYAGTGTDPEDGTLPASAFTWRVDYHTGSVIRPFVPPTPGSRDGTFEIPTITPYTEPDVFYRIHLTVTDSDGMSHSVTRDLLPNTASISLATSPPGLSVDLDGQPRTGPHAFVGVVGLTRPLSAPLVQRIGGVTYAFESWSDGGLAAHELDTPSSNTTLTARYRLSTAQGLLFDFGTASSPVETGYSRVTSATSYSSERGFGWLPGAVSLSSVDTGQGMDALRRDHVRAADATYAVDLPSGVYDVMLTLGDAAAARDRTGVFLEGVQRDDVTTSASSPIAVRTYRVTVTDGRLEIRLDDLGGTDPLVAVAGITIFDLSGPRVAAVVPSPVSAVPFSSVDVTFNEPISVSSFDLDSVAAASGPLGELVTQEILRLDSRRYRINFASQAAPGPYQIILGTSITDEAGNRMDQDGDAINSESTDGYTAAIDEVLDLASLPGGPYSGGQDAAGLVTFANGGTLLHLAGNRWRHVDRQYTVTPDTVLAFDFQSTAQGDVHAIGLDNDTNQSVDRTFQLYGTQTFGLQQFHNYQTAGGQLRHYTIPVGQFFTGSVSRLFFINDHDVSNPSAVSAFSNVQLHEGDVNHLPVAQDDEFTVLSSANPATLNVLANDTTSPDTGQTLTLLQVSAGSAGGTITRSGNQVTYRPAAGFFGRETFTYTVGDGSSGSAATASVTVDVALDLDSVPGGAYGSDQDGTGHAVFESNGSTLHLTGNRWRRVDQNYTITADTVLEFDFRSPVQGELHAIGLDTDLDQSEDRTFQLYGTQSFGRQNFRDYGTSAGQWRHYTIPVGQFYTGSVSRLFVINDHDVTNPTAESLFRNVQLYEGTTNHPPVAQDDQFSVLSTANPALLGVLANDTTSPDTGETLTLLQVGPGSAGGAITRTGNQVSYRPMAGYLGPEAFTYTVGDGTPGSTATATVTVDVALDLDSVPGGAYGSGQDGAGTAIFESNGSTLHLTGNRWRRVDRNYSITPDTVLEFDFRSPLQGELHAIGLDTDLAESQDRTFQLYGTQSFGLQQFRDYATAGGQWRHYTIPVGQFLTGGVTRLFFINDHDVTNPTAESFFRNVQLYEPSVNQEPTAANDTFTVLSSARPAELNVLANDTSAPDAGETLAIVRAGPGSAGGTIGISGNRVLYQPPAGFFGTETFTYTVSDGTPGSLATATVTVEVVLDLASVPGGPYGSGQEVTGQSAIDSGGTTLGITGNRWRRVDISHTITPDTVLEFDFRSGVQGDVHAIGLDTDLSQSDDRTFQLYGTQTFGRQDFRNYQTAGSQWRHYTIPVGQFYTGSVSRLFFINDHDVTNPTAESFFRHVQLHEADASNQALAVSQAAFSTGEEFWALDRGVEAFVHRLAAGLA